MKKFKLKVKDKKRKKEKKQKPIIKNEKTKKIIGRPSTLPKQRIWIYDPMGVVEGKKETELPLETVIGFKVNGKIFRVKYNAKNDCIAISCMNNTTYIQPVTTAEFLIK